MTNREALNQLEQPYRSQAWTNFVIQNSLEQRKRILEEESIGLAVTIDSAFNWRRSKEGSEYWFNYHEKLAKSKLVSPNIPVVSEDIPIEEPNKLLTRREYYETLEEPYRTQAFEYTPEESLDSPCRDVHHAIAGGFLWDKTPQKHAYWSTFSVSLI